MPELDLFTNPVGLPQVTTAGTIYYEVDSVNPGVRREWVAGGSRTTIVARVKALQMALFNASVVGTVRGNGAGFLARTPPERVKSINFIEQYGTRVEEIDCGGHPADPVAGPARDIFTGWPIPKWQRCRVTFEGLPYLVLSDLQVAGITPSQRELARYVTRKRRSMPRELNLPGGGFKVVGTTAQINQTQSLVIPYASYTYVWHRVPFDLVPRVRLQSMEGKVNLIAFDTLTAFRGINAAPETVLFRGWDTDDYFDATGVFVSDVRYDFETINYEDATPPDEGGPFKMTWNKYLTSSRRAVSVTHNGSIGGQKPYSAADLNTLFVPL